MRGLLIRIHACAERPHSRTISNSPRGLTAAGRIFRFGGPLIRLAMIAAHHRSVERLGAGLIGPDGPHRIWHPQRLPFLLN
jgi:hypothetical protein